MEIGSYRVNDEFAEGKRFPNDTPKKGGLTDAEDLFKKAPEEAAKLGANAVIIGGFTQGNYNAFTGTTSLNQASAIAIRYWIVRP